MLFILTSICTLRGKLDKDQLYPVFTLNLWLLFFSTFVNMTSESEYDINDLSDDSVEELSYEPTHTSYIGVSYDQ
jgi:hypothetical protein